MLMQQKQNDKRTGDRLMSYSGKIKKLQDCGAGISQEQILHIGLSVVHYTSARNMQFYANLQLVLHISTSIIVL